MSQLSLIAPPPAGDPPKMRPYQEEAIAAVIKDLETSRATLCQMATGLGKTVVFSEIIRRWGSRCLVIAHRDELIQQAAKALERATGRWPQVEQAGSVAHPRGSEHVIASIQTLCQPRRLERFARDAFGLVVVDEVHHGVAPTYRRVLNHFADAKLLGLTATPDRADNEALGQILDSVAFQYDLPDAIRDGWLARPVLRSVKVETMDFSQLHTVAGDFNQGELDTLMAREQNLHAVARPAVELSGDRKTIVFTTSVANAHRLAEIIDRYAGVGAAVAVDGKMDVDDRRRHLARFAEGQHRFLVNVGIATEGYDCPAVACIVMGRPTKSRSLYSQMIGRGTRGGVNCPVPGKTDCLVLDFVGNAGRHDIVSAADVLGGEYSDEEIARTKAELEQSDEPLDFEEAARRAKEKHEALKAKLEAEERERKKRQSVTVQVSYSIHEVNPFVHFDVKRDYRMERYGQNPATEAQLGALKRMMGNHAKDLPPNLSKHEASRMLAKFADRAAGKLATYSQLKLLMKYGFDARGWSFENASKAITKIKDNGWQVPTA